MSEDRELFSDRMLEGEYTTWQPVWEYDFGILIQLSLVSVDNDGTVYIYETTGPVTVVRTYAGATQVRWTHRLLTPVSYSSGTGKYALIRDTTTLTRLEVWRRGAEIARITITDADPLLTNFSGIAQSPNGKFVAMICTRAAGWYQYVVLFEGV